MRVKSYYAATVEAAMALARKELGEDALLLASRPAMAEARHLGAYEVVFGLAEEAAASPKTAPLPPAAGAVPAGGESVGRELAGLRREIGRLGAALARAQGGTGLPPSLAILRGALVEADVSPAFAGRLAGRLAAHPLARALDDDAAPRWRPLLAAELGRLVGSSPELGRVAAFVGPPGAGKTSALVKIAIRYGLARRQPVLFVSIDNLRVAAAGQLRAYAEILGVAFEQVETGRALGFALDQHRQKGLILVDTPGLGPRDQDAAAELAGELDRHPEVDTHLVLTAGTRSADLQAAVDRFEKFAPRKLLFTRLDETSSVGPLIETAAGTGKPLSFLSCGQRIPEDLEPAGVPDLVDRFLSGLWLGPDTARAQAGSATAAA